MIYQLYANKFKQTDQIVHQLFQSKTTSIPLQHLKLCTVSSAGFFTAISRTNLENVLAISRQQAFHCVFR